MPPTGNPYRAFPNTDSVQDVTSGVRSLRTHILTALHRATLTRALAEGADSTVNGELELRARQLTSQRNRRMLATSLRRTIADARKPTITRAAVSIIDRRAALDAEAAITDMIQRLLAPQPVRAQGMALLLLIITNADGSPLYNPSEPGTLRRMIRDATAALDPQLAQSHEFSLAV
jgi:hypothetical protein